MNTVLSPNDRTFISTQVEIEPETQKEQTSIIINDDNVVTNATPQKFFAAILSIWGFASFALLDLFPTTTFLKKYNQTDILHWQNMPLSNSKIILLAFTSFFLLCSFITIFLIVAIPMYQKASQFIVSMRNGSVKKAVSQFSISGWFGFALSMVTMFVYAMWSYFDTDTLFHNQTISILSALGNAIFVLLFVTPIVVSLTNSIYEKFCEKLRQRKEGEIKIKLIPCLVILAPVLGECLISPIFVDAMETEMQKKMHVKDKNIAIVLSITFVAVSAVTLVICTQGETSHNEEKDNASDCIDQNKRRSTSIYDFLNKIPGGILLIGTCVIGGIGSTYIGLSDLHWFGTTKAAQIGYLVWSCVASLYWLIFYRDVIPMVADFFNHKATTKQEQSDVTDDESERKESSATVTLT